MRDCLPTRCQAHTALRTTTTQAGSGSGGTGPFASAIPIPVCPSALYPSRLLSEIDGRPGPVDWKAALSLQAPPGLQAGLHPWRANGRGRTNDLPIFLVGKAIRRSNPASLRGMLHAACCELYSTRVQSFIRARVPTGPASEFEPAGPKTALLDASARNPREPTG